MNDLRRRLAGIVPAPLEERIRALPPVRSALVAMLLVLLAIVLIDGAGDSEPGSNPEASAGQKGPPGVAEAMEGMTAADKVAQLFLFGFEGTGPDSEIFDRMRDLDLGGVVPTSDNYVDEPQFERMADEAAKVADRAGHVAPWIIAAQEGEELSAFPDLPPADLPASLGSPSKAAGEADESAKEMRSIGVNGVLGPGIDVGPEERGSLGARAYSDSPAEVTAYADETVRAYEEQEIFAAAKHFPGLGGAPQPTELGPANVGLSEDELARRDLRPFRAAIDAGVPGVVVSNGLYSSGDHVTPASLSSEIVTDLLRGQMGFDGVAITDDLSEPGVTATFPVADAAVESFKAGADIVYISERSDDQEEAYRAVLTAVGEGDIPIARIDESLRRVLAAKSEYEVLD